MSSLSEGFLSDYKYLPMSDISERLVPIFEYFHNIAKFSDIVHNTTLDNIIKLETKFNYKVRYNEATAYELQNIRSRHWSLPRCSYLLHVTLYDIKLVVIYIYEPSVSLLHILDG